MIRNEIRQGHRVCILLIYIGILFLINWLAFDTLIPVFGIKGFWFYASLLNLLLGSHLITPYYNKPVDAIAYGVPAFIALLLINNWAVWSQSEKVVFLCGIIFCLVVVVIAFLSIFFKDSDKPSLKNISESCRIISDLFGSSKIIYSVVLLLSIYIFHRTSAKEVFLISLAWALTVALQPCEILYRCAQKIKELWSTDLPSHIIGEIAAYQTPGIILIRQQKQEHLPFATPLLINDPQSSVRVGMSLDYVGRDEGVLLRAIEIGETINLEDSCLNIQQMYESSVIKLEAESFNPQCGKIKDAVAKSEELVGVVAPETSVDRLYFEVVQAGDIEEGRLVETTVGKDKVLYQIIDGLTKEEVVSQKNTFGYARAKAQKIGIWNEEKKKFVHAKWIPQLNEPVYLKSATDFLPQENVVGHFPETNYTVSIKNIHEMVTHNTAILGIMGIGKSMLAIELVERMITEGIKVICLDLTDQYAKLLEPFYNNAQEKELLSEINTIGIRGKTNVKQNVEEGGSINEFTEKMKVVLKAFVESDTETIKIFNPAQFEAWRQDSKPFSGNASMVSLTPTEITRIITEAILEIAQEQGMSEDGKAKYCLVYEEAHSLVPEWNSVASDGDKAATNGTARAILQGRKYGMGCLLITQRTANVTKTILNQCNTIFAMRSFDKTGKDFLSDYMGKEYAEKLSILQERQAVFFGKASSCENPVMIRLNDRDKFTEAFRKVNPLPVFQAVIEAREQLNETTCDVSTDDEDIPF